MIDKLGKIEVERYTKAGYYGKNADRLAHPIIVEDHSQLNTNSSYTIFLVSAIYFIIIQQLMFYGMSLLVGTQREENRSFASLPDQFEGHGVNRVVLGRGLAYLLVFMGIGLYIAFIVPSLFGIPIRGQFFNTLAALTFFVVDCIFFSMFWSSLITRRESVFVLFLFMSPICLFLAGSSWPTFAFPKFWKLFSYIFPSNIRLQGLHQRDRGRRRHQHHRGIPDSHDHTDDRLLFPGLQHGPYREQDYPPQG